MRKLLLPVVLLSLGCDVLPTSPSKTGAVSTTGNADATWLVRFVTTGGPTAGCHTLQGDELVVWDFNIKDTLTDEDTIIELRQYDGSGDCQKGVWTNPARPIEVARFSRKGFFSYSVRMPPCGGWWQGDYKLINLATGEKKNLASPIVRTAECAAPEPEPIPYVPPYEPPPAPEPIPEPTPEPPPVDPGCPPEALDCGNPYVPPTDPEPTPEPEPIPEPEPVPEPEPIPDPTPEPGCPPFEEAPDCGRPYEPPVVPPCDLEKEPDCLNRQVQFRRGTPLQPE